jgi:hypothetical protein
MKNFILMSLLFLSVGAMAADAAHVEKLQTEYKLTDAQAASLKNSGLPDSQLAVAARLFTDLPKGSTTTIDDILKMRQEQHMGWGEIAKKLGVPPKEIGQAIAAEHRQNEKHNDREMKDDRRADREDRADSHKDKDHGKGH